MPELPEVETLRRGLESKISGRRITGVIIANATVLKEQTEAAFRERILGNWILQINRRGKYLLFSLGETDQPAVNQPNHNFEPDSGVQSGVVPNSSPFFLCVHLKMRGQLLLQSADSLPLAYHCITLLIDGTIALRFYDMWAWGEMRALSSTELVRETGLSQMGAEPLSEAWTIQEFERKLVRRNSPIKSVLLDQKVVAGIGNIYADESLFRAGIHPERHASSLTSAEVSRLRDAIQTVLREAIDGGGTYSEEYVDVAGRPGRYTPRVYDRGAKPCMVCDTLLTRIRLGGRGTVYCSRCQPV